MESNYDFYVAIKAIKNGVDVGFSNEVRVKGEKNDNHLLTTLWNQPDVIADVDQDGIKSNYKTGCTSVAVGQLINYWLKNGYSNNWLDVMLQNVTAYPSIETCSQDGGSCKTIQYPVELKGYKTLDGYSDDSNDSDVQNLLFNTAIGLDTKFGKCKWDSKINEYSCGEGSGGGNNSGYDHKFILNTYGLNNKDHWSNEILTLLKDRFRFSISDPITYETTDGVIPNSMIPFIYNSIIVKKQPILLGIFGKHLKPKKDKDGNYIYTDDGLGNKIYSYDDAGHAVIIDGYRKNNDGRSEININYGWGLFGVESCNTGWHYIDEPMIAYYPCKTPWLKFTNFKFLFASPMQ
jgi:hypothetical protein